MLDIAYVYMLLLKPPDVIKIKCELFFLDQTETIGKFINELDQGSYLSVLKVANETYLYIGII